MCSRIRKVGFWFFFFFLMKLQGLPWYLGLCTFTAGDTGLILKSCKLCCLAIKIKKKETGKVQTSRLKKQRQR